MKRYSINEYRILNRFFIYDSKTNLRTPGLTLKQLLHLQENNKNFNAMFRIVFEKNSNYIFIFGFEAFENINDIIINKYPELLL